MSLVIRKPVITEKSVSEANARNIYLFEVDPLANKHQIKSEIESLFNVEVLGVRTLRHPGKQRRTGKRRLMSRSASTKKAFVHVKPGQKIDLFEVVQN